jgi:hypothetical protein
MTAIYSFGKLSVVEQALPRCQADLQHQRGLNMVDGLRLEG